MSYRWPPRYRTMNAARVERGKYKCNICQNIVGRKDIKVDHVIPVVDPTLGFVDWNTYIARMFAEDGGFQVLCDTCHDAKTAGERALKKATRPPKPKKVSKRLTKKLTSS